jgi:hypothetical protein
MADITNILAMGPQPTTQWQNPLDLEAKRQQIRQSQAAVRSNELEDVARRYTIDQQRANQEAWKRAAAEAGKDHEKLLELLPQYGASPDLINQTRNSLTTYRNSLAQAKEAELKAHEEENKRKANIIDAVMEKTQQDVRLRPFEYQRVREEAAKEGVNLPDWISADALDMYRQGLGIEGSMAEQERLKRAQAIQQQQVDAATMNAETNAARLTETQRKNLRDKGLKLNDETGEIEAVSFDEMSPTEQQKYLDNEAITALRAANTEKAQADAAYKQAQAENDPVKMQLALQRLAVSRQNAQNATNNFNARYKGILPDGTAVPGSLVDESGTVVPPVSAPNVRPTASSRTAAERANTALTLDAKMRATLDKNPKILEYLGPFAGRWSELEGHLGDLPRDVAEFLTDAQSYAAFQAGQHPIRGLGGLQWFDAAFGGLAQSKDQLLGKMDSYKGTAEDVRRVGTPKTVGAGQKQVPTITTKEQYDALPKGAPFIWGGKQGTKP